MRGSEDSVEQRRARAAAAIAVARAALPQLRPQPDGHALAAAALDAAARWAAGAAVPAQALADLLIDEREEGLLLHDQRCDDAARRLAWHVVETALAITAWHAFHVAGELPATLVAEVDDDTPALLRAQALAAGLPAAELDILLGPDARG